MIFFNKPKNLDDADDHKLLDNYRETGDLAILGRLFEEQMPLGLWRLSQIFKR